MVNKDVINSLELNYYMNMNYILQLYTLPLGFKVIFQANLPSFYIGQNEVHRTC